MSGCVVYAGWANLYDAARNDTGRHRFIKEDHWYEPDPSH